MAATGESTKGDLLSESPERRVLSFLAVGDLWKPEAARCLLLGFLSDSLTQHGRVIPGETQIWVRGVTPQGAQRLGSLGIILQKDVALLTLNKGKHIDIVARHWGLRAVGGGWRSDGAETRGDRATPGECLALSSVSRGKLTRCCDSMPSGTFVPGSYRALSVGWPLTHHSRFSSATAG